jgi:flagellar motor switch protein FliN
MADERDDIPQSDDLIGKDRVDDLLAASEAGQAFSKTVNPGDASESDAEAAMLAMLDELPQEDAKARPEDINFSATSVSKAEFQQLQQTAGSQEPRNIDLLMDVDLPVSIELGRTKMSISDILALGPGSVVELNKLAGEPVDLLVNYKVVARGEVVVVDENFGLRITQLMTPEERLRSLANE